MKISQEPAGQGVKLILAGELTLQNCPEIESALKKIAQTKTECVIVDMRKVDYVDSSGLRLLVDYHHQISALGGKLIIFGATRNVKKVMQVTHLDQVFTLQDEPDTENS